MEIIIIKSTWLNIPNVTHGWGNGYVIIPKGHQLHGIPHSHIYIDVHGGLTFSEEVNDNLIKWSEGDVHPKHIGGWMVGFDTGHSRDTLDNWPQEAVYAEALRLRDQLLNYKN